MIVIEKPYGFITSKPINITIDKTGWTYDVKYHLANGSRTAEIPLASGYHTVSVSHIVNIVPNKIRFGQMVNHLTTGHVLSDF